MRARRLTLLMASLLLALAWAGTAAAKTYYLGGSSGGQIQVGGGLPLPIQLTDADFNGVPDWGATMSVSSLGTMGGPGGAVFPPLLIPKKTPLVTVMGTTAMTMGQALTIPASVFSTPGVQKTLGQHAQNNVLYAVGTRLRIAWPAALTMLSARTMTPTPSGTVTLPTNGSTVLMRTAGTRMVTYKNPGATAPFGGAANFLITGVTGPGAGNYTSIPVSVYVVGDFGGAMAGNPPCTHPMFATGTNPGNPLCLAHIVLASPVGPQAPGGMVSTFVNTTPAVFVPSGTGPVKAGTMPLGTLISFSKGAAAAGFKNTASSLGFPWTTGMLSVSAAGATGVPEKFILTGADNRTPGGSGTIQLVSGSLSTRNTSGPNANRAWIKLVLKGHATGAQLPAVPVVGLGVLAGSLLAIGLVMTARRRRGESEA